VGLRLCQEKPKDNQIAIRYFSAKHSALKSKERLAQHQDNVPKWSDMITP